MVDLVLLIGGSFLLVCAMLGWPKPMPEGSRDYRFGGLCEELGCLPLDMGVLLKRYGFCIVDAASPEAMPEGWICVGDTGCHCPRHRNTETNVQPTEEEQEWFEGNGYGRDAGPTEVRMLIRQMRRIEPLLNRAGLRIVDDARAKAMPEGWEFDGTRLISPSWQILSLPALRALLATQGLHIVDEVSVRVLEACFEAFTCDERKVANKLQDLSLLVKEWPRVKAELARREKEKSNG